MIVFGLNFVISFHFVMKSSFYFILGVKFSFKNIYCWKSQIFKLIFSLFKNKIKVIFIIVGPKICCPGPFLRWGPRPEPRKGIAEDG